jgi:polyphosphate glucokinase
VDDAWIDTDAQTLFQEVTGRPVTVINDADAAGLAELSFGAGRDQKGVVLIVTLGTGIGTSLFVDGHLLPNTELGHIEIDGVDAEVWAAESARKRQKLSWKEWAGHVGTYLGWMEFLFSPDLIIIGGGVSKKAEKFFPHIELKTPMVPAQMLNNAGIVGAAMAAVRP